MLACSIATILSGCGSLERLRIEEAAADRGRAEARVSLPAWPDDCRKKEPHAALAEGAEIRSILKRERGALDRQNARTDRCAGHYDELAREIGGGP